MKYYHLLLPTCLLCLFTACEPKFDLNAPYKDVTVVYGILNYQDSIHYVKIYKGFQSNDVYIDARNPDNIYYYDDINVALLESKDGRSTGRRIPLKYTHDFPRDAGIFYYEDERIIYYTTEEIKQGMDYKIVIKNNLTEKVTTGETPIVDDFKITTFGAVDMTALKGTISFSKAEHAAGYEIHVNFLYFEVDKNTNQVVKTGKISKNITPEPGQGFRTNSTTGDFFQDFALTFYDDIAAQLKPNDDVIRYMGRPNSKSPIEVIGWAAGESMINFLLSSRPTNSFTQVNTIYTNMETAKGELVFGFLSSKVETKPPTYLPIVPTSEEELIQGSKTGHLGFRPYIEYRP